MGRSRTHSPRALLTAAVLVALLVPASALAAQDSGVFSQPAHPADPGAPFRPDPQRVEAVLARAEILQAIESLDLAEASLLGHSEVDRTSQILSSQRASYNRQLDELGPALEALSEDTDAWGIAVGAFPVDELRKEFWDDWHQPRSGGRRHLGTDMLAQIGVPLRAIEDGVFERYSNGGLGGVSIYLRGDSGARYFYTHLASTEEYVEGERIFAGEIIGTNGESGNARGVPHLHLQIAPDGESGWENPYPLLESLWGEGTSEPIPDEPLLEPVSDVDQP